MNNSNHDETASIAALGLQLGLEPASIQGAFNYCLCQMMVEAGQMELVAKVAGDSGSLCHFQSADGQQFVVPEPDLSPEQFTQLKVIMRQIWLKDSDEQKEP
jgi:hypothetical protein